MARGVGFTYESVKELCQKVTEETYYTERSSLTNLDIRSEGFIPHFYKTKHIEIEAAFKNFTFKGEKYFEQKTNFKSLFQQK